MRGGRFQLLLVSIILLARVSAPSASQHTAAASDITESACNRGKPISAITDADGALEVPLLPVIPGE